MSVVSKVSLPHQVAAIPFRHGETVDLAVLLVTSRTRRRWILPKGKVPPGMLPSRAAEREAFEEAGVLGRIEKSPVASYRQHRASGSAADTYLVQAFALDVTDELPVWHEMRQRERRWFDLADAIRVVRDREIRHALRVFAQSRQS